MTILYLYSELAAYNFPVFRELVASYDAHIHVVHWEPHRLRPVQRPAIDHVHYYNRSSLTERAIVDLAESISPNITYVSGWMDKGYLPAAKRLKEKGVPVVIGFDDQWRGTLRQWVGSALFRIYLARFFSHAWVAGPRQYEYARRLGFKHQDIIFGLLTCDSDLFEVAGACMSQRKMIFPKSFLYVGRFIPVKGVDLLVKAFEKYRDEFRGDWRMICVGSGDLGPLLSGQAGIEVRNFMDQDSLIKLFDEAGVFVLPSRLDQWGVVVHEAASAGLPLLLSENVGAKDLYLIEGYNGISFVGDSVTSLAQAMYEISQKTTIELVDMGEKSRLLAQQINPSLCAANLVSVLKKCKQGAGQYLVGGNSVKERK